MTVQTLKIGKDRLIVLREQDYKKLLAQIGAEHESNAENAVQKARNKPHIVVKKRQTRHFSASATAAEDRHDAAILRKRLSDMRRRGEKPILYSLARKEMSLG